MRKFFPISWMAMNIVGFIVSLIIYVGFAFVLFLLKSSTADWFIIRYFTAALFYVGAIYSVVGIGLSCFNFFTKKDNA